MNAFQDNSNGNMQDQNMVILSTFQNIELYDFQDGSFCNGFLIISKDLTSFYFRWISYMSNKNILASSSEKEDQLINSIHLFRVVIETSYQHCEVSLYCVEHDEPTVFRTDKNHVNFSHQLAQIFTINSVFLNNNNWIRLAQMFIKPPTAETGSIIYYLPCYNGKFSFPVFLTGQILKNFKKSNEKSKKESENQTNQTPPASPSSSGDQNSRTGSFKSFFNFTKFTNSSIMTSKLTKTDKSTESNSILSNFSQIFSKYKIKNINIQLPLTKSDFMLLTSQGVSMNEIKKMILNQGMDEELRSEMWPIFLSILPRQEKAINLEEVSEHQKILQLRLNEYKSLKFQWSSLSEYQLVESKELRSAFYTIKMDVKRTSIPDELLSHLSNNDEINVKRASLLFKKVLKNILKTFSVWNYRIRYTQGINEIAVPFVCIALYGTINTIISKSEQNIGLSELFQSNRNDSSFIDCCCSSSSANLTNSSFDNLSSNLIELIEEKEAIAFWCFVSFMEKSQNVLLETSMTNLMEIDMPEILEIVKKQSQRDVFKFIKQYQLDSLNFLVSPFMLLFRRSFNEASVERLWDSIIVMDDFSSKNGSSGGGGSGNSSLIKKKNFELAFAASVVIFVIPLLRKKLANSQLTNEDINETILLEMSDLIESLPIEYVIRVALSIENDLPVKTQPRIVVDCKKDFDEIEFFSPSMLSETNEYSKLGLFY